MRCRQDQLRAMGSSGFMCSLGWQQLRAVIRANRGIPHHVQGVIGAGAPARESDAAKTCYKYNYPGVNRPYAGQLITELTAAYQYNAYNLGYDFLLGISALLCCLL